MPKLVTLSRFNVIKALFERCQARQASAEIKALTQALIQAYGGDKKSLVPKLCHLEDIKAKNDENTNNDDSSKKKRKNGDHDPLAKNRASLVSHGSHLATTMLSIPGPTSDAIQTSILSLSAEQLYHLASSSGPTSHVVTAALKTASSNKAFHKAIVVALRPRVAELVLDSEHGDRVVTAMVNMPTTQPVTAASTAAAASSGTAVTASASLPLHLKEAVMTSLGEREKDMRDSFAGRRVWRNVKADLWAHRRAEWVQWQRDIAQIVVVARQHGSSGGAGGRKGKPTGSNDVAVASRGAGGQTRPPFGKPNGGGGGGGGDAGGGRGGRGKR
ncbi:hypothetical protein Micbo1qcDRAFT_13586 [Microdochium bolleyi]|uniref:Nucleolar protein 9 n=1 Tax=Microdochium bolleyi TaxID=196109 RepID=A0A136II81_9PEZI|nr:hypothetical protein Micbo1qcDRAFT_13586 [Microdochium bolleyi]